MTERFPPRLGLAGILAMALSVGGAGGAQAHGGAAHVAEPEAATPAAGAIEVSVPEPFPAAIGGPFALIDHTGKPVTDADFRGRFMLVFFSYAQCEGLCPVGLGSMAAAVDLLRASGARVRPILISVDSESDTPEALARYVAAIHPRLVGLTGSRAAVDAVQSAYKVASEFIGRSAKGAPVFSHGSYIYLMGPDGRLLTVLPPVLDPRAMPEIVRRYLS